MVGVHSGQRSRSTMTAQTRSGGAAMSTVMLNVVTAGLWQRCSFSRLSRASAEQHVRHPLVKNLPLIRQARLQHHSLGGTMRWEGNSNHRRQAELHAADAHTGTGHFGGQTATPELRIEPVTDLDLV